MTERRAVAVWTLALALAAGSSVLVFASDHEPHPWRTVALAVPVGVAFVGGGLIGWLARPGNRTGALMTLVGLTWFLSALRMSNDPTVFSVGIAVDSVTLGLVAWLFLAFPGGRLEDRAARAIASAALVLFGPWQLARVAFTDPERHLGCSDCPRNVFEIGAPQMVGDVLQAVSLAAALALVVAIALLLVRRWRSGTATYRRAVLPVFASSGAVLVVLAGNTLAESVGSERAQDVTPLIAWPAYLMIPLSLLFGLLRGRLAHRGVGRLLRELSERPTPGLTVESIRRALRDPTLEVGFWTDEARYVDSEGRPFELPVPDAHRASTIVAEEGRPVAVLVHDPSLLENRGLLDSVVAAARLGLERERLHAELLARLDELRRERDFVRTVVHTAPSFFCDLELDGRIFRYNDTLARATGCEDRDAFEGRRFWDVFAAPADRERARASLAAGELVGELRMTAADGAERIVTWTSSPIEGSDGTPRLLLCGLDLTERHRHEDELRASRQRIVEAGDAERRRLERNLHDGAQQRLVSLALALRLARGQVAQDPRGAEELLEAASTELTRALDELRELARGIHPAVLTERGLDAAVEGLARRSPVPVTLDAIGERLPPPIEAAAYYVVSEALANAAKYARATSVGVRIARADGRVLVDVVDDGVGGADPSLGTGLYGLVDRLEALDGILAVESPVGSGTRIHAEIPVRSVTPAQEGGSRRLDA